MKAEAGHLTLSPSDLNDYVVCAHLTTLALEVARGERVRPHVAYEQAELLLRPVRCPLRDGQVSDRSLRRR